MLLDGEVAPKVLKTTYPYTVVWSSLWKERPDAVIPFDLSRDKGGHGTDLRWTVKVEEPLPGDGQVSHMRKRLIADSGASSRGDHAPVRVPCRS